MFVLGAYPSALHVRWTPPTPWRSIAAIAVDNEPTPFWTGEDQIERVDRWRAAVGWDPAWGEVRSVGALNGPSGAWVADQVFGPLGVTREDAWITDCLDIYHASTGAAGRIADTYAPFAKAHGLIAADLGAHPSEAAIVTEALAQHRVRLLDELARATPDVVVTLGNAALRVLGSLGTVDGGAPRGLATEGYGKSLRLRIAGRTVTWLPLTHPAAPEMYQAAHRAWRARTEG